MVKHNPPFALNVLIWVIAFAAYLGTLWGATHAESLPLVLLCVVIFSYAGNTLFSLLHESVHRVFSKNNFANEFFGTWIAACFPTGLSFQRTCHLGHHLRNRTDHEMFDMYYPEDNKFLKFAQFYSILTGIYWLFVVLGWVIYLIAPFSYRLLKSDHHVIKHTGAIMMHPFIEHPKKWRIRAELFFTVALQVLIFWGLELKIWPTLACFWAFGLHWGSLQYADHAWSPRDIRSGAWNLRVNPVTRWIFLNYHVHQVHHSQPGLPWLYLPKYKKIGAPEPTFWKIYFEMWRGPKPANAPNPPAVEEAFERAIKESETQAPQWA